MADWLERFRSGGALVSGRRFAVLARDADGWEQDLRKAAETEFDELLLESLRPGPDGGVRVSPYALAVLRELGVRAIQMRATTGQLRAIAALLNSVSVEMNTGEGKTLVGALAACAFASAGSTVHVLSPNDYLAARDRAAMRAIFERTGLSSATVTSASTHDERTRAYRTRIVYAPIHEIGYDLLRDRISVDPALRVSPTGDVAICDEADALLIDANISPLVIARGSGAGPDNLDRVTAAVASLRLTTHFLVADDGSGVVLTESGVSALEKQLGIENLFARIPGETLGLIQLALNAHALLKPGRDYLVRDGRILLIDSALGRIAYNHRYPDGLHLAVESKEDVERTEVGRPLDSMTIHEVAQRYGMRVGMSGTLVDVAPDLFDHYGMTVTRIDPDTPLIRRDEPERRFATFDDKLAALIAEISEAHGAGQPVLIGTQSVPESEDLATALRAHGLNPVVLNARNDATEARVIAEAGRLGSLTISTQISGRGADITLGGNIPEERALVRELGGLLVIATSRHGVRRLDAQLRGRAGRRGDPGRTIRFLSMQDSLMRGYAPAGLLNLALSSKAHLLGRPGAHAAESAQAISDARHLDRHRDIIAYTAPVREQRAVVLGVREQLLDRNGDALSAHLDNRVSTILASSDDDLIPWRELINILDAEWSHHLEAVAEVRDGVHLFALEGKAPQEEFTRILGGLFPEYWNVVAERVEDAILRAQHGDSGALIVPRETEDQVWEYLQVSDPYGSALGRFISNVRTRVGRKRR